MQKLPEYLDDIADFIAEQEEKYLGTPKEEAKKNLIKEAIEESLTAKNPAEKKNPTTQIPNELEIFMDTLSDSELGRRLPHDEKVNLFRRMELLANHYSELILKYVMGIGDKCLMFEKNMNEEMKKEISKRRYYRLAIQTMIMALLLRPSRYTSKEIKEMVGFLEDNKDLSTLMNIGNRVAHATVVGGGMDVMLKRAEPTKILEFFNRPDNNQENKRKIKKVYEEKMREAEQKYRDLGVKGSTKRKLKVDEERKEEGKFL